MKSVKKMLAALLALIMVLSLAACGDSSETTTAAAGTTAAGATEATTEDVFDDYPITIKVWVCNSGAGYEYLQAAASEFNAKQDLYIIDLSYAGSYQDVLLKISGSESGSRPDIFMADTESMYSILANEELYVPIQEYIDSDGYDMSSMMGNLESTYTQDGEWQCMPLGNTVTGFFYNEDALTEAGIDARTDLGSYEEILEACRKLKAAGHQYPFYMHTSSGFYSFAMTAQGIQYVDNNNGKDDIPTRCLIGDEGSDAYNATVSFFQFLKTMKEEDLMLPFGTTVADGRASFCNEECCIYTEFISSYATVTSAVSDAFTVGFHECPTINAGATNYGQCTGGGCLFLANNDANENCKYNEIGAWEFMKFLMTDENTSGFAMATGYLPTTVSGHETAEYQNFLDTKFPTAKYSIEAQQNTDESCYNAWMPMFSDFHALCREFYTKAYNDDTSAEELTRKFASAVNDCIDLWHMSND